MATPSKEKQILRLILESSPLKEWHFEDFVREGKVSRLVANKWLKRYVGQGLLKHVKIEGRFPYYQVGRNNPIYHSQKRLFALEEMHRSGLLPSLLSIHSAKTIILFGSMAKGDWYKDSDIDIFILGDISEFDKKLFEERLNKRIEIHIFKDRADVSAVRSGLISNIVNGYLLKGQIQDFAEVK